MKFKVKEKHIKTYKLIKLQGEGSASAPLYSLVDSAGKQILTSSNLFFVVSFSDRLVGSGHSVAYSDIVSKDIKDNIPFA